MTSFGEMPYSDLQLDQIKGITYPLDVFVGPRHPFMKGLDASFKGRNCLTPPQGLIIILQSYSFLNIVKHYVLEQ